MLSIRNGARSTPAGSAWRKPEMCATDSAEVAYCSGPYSQYMSQQERKPMDTPAPQIDATVRAQVTDGLLQKLNEHYIFPYVAAAMGEAIRTRATNGEYDAMTDGKVLA